MQKKSILRLIRELRAAQTEDLVVFFDICSELVVTLGDATPATERHYLRVSLNETVAYDKAKQLKDYLVANFDAIERVVLIMRAGENGAIDGVRPELKIYTKGKPPR